MRSAPGDRPGLTLAEGGAASWRQQATSVTLWDASCIMPYLPIFQKQRQSGYLCIFLECWSKNQSSKQKKTKNAAQATQNTPKGHTWLALGLHFLLYLNRSLSFWALSQGVIFFATGLPPPLLLFTKWTLIQMISSFI